jgi:uncharacterized repeat protein (TIGR03803 family)
MLISDRLRRLAANSSLALLCFTVQAQAQVPALARTQSANVISVVSFGTSAVTDAPAAVRGGLLRASDGNIYFVSSSGGKGSGAIGRLAPDGTLSVLYAFAGSSEGVSAFAGLMQASDGNLYGTTYLGGEKGGGVAFRVGLDGTFSVLRSFGQDNKDAVLPYAGLMQAVDGNLYGTTLRGGNNDKGTIFRLGLDGAFAIIHHFDGANGENPESTLIAGADGNLYGTTLQGGSQGRGTIFRITTSGTFTSVYSFPSLGAFNTSGLATNTTGANPRAGLLLAADGNLYGTAYQGGASGWGTIFRMTAAGTVSTVRSFAGPSFDGGFPLAGIVQDAAGNLYGTTERGGYLNQGAVWRIDSSGQYSLLHGFINSLLDGAQPYAAVLVANNSLYAVTYSDSFSSAGAIVKLDVGSNGVLPVELSVSATEIATGSSATLTWSSPTATACTASGAWNNAVTTSGTLAVTPASAGIYTYALSCTDGAGVVRNAYAGLVVKAPPTQPVDGGGGAGSVSAVLLLLFAALLSRKYFKELFPACP